MTCQQQHLIGVAVLLTCDRDERHAGMHHARREDAAGDWYWGSNDRFVEQFRLPAPVTSAGLLVWVAAPLSPLSKNT